MSTDHVQVRLSLTRSEALGLVRTAIDADCTLEDLVISSVRAMTRETVGPAIDRLLLERVHESFRTAAVELLLADDAFIEQLQHRWAELIERHQRQRRDGDAALR